MPPSSKTRGLFRRFGRFPVPPMPMARRRAMSRMWRTPNKPMCRPVRRGCLFGCVFPKTSVAAKRPRWSGLRAASS
eukprot:1743606-Lingulodinium_polyedra.AAC.1